MKESTTASQVQIRRQAYWAILCGATGQFMGNRPIWLFDPGWEAALNPPARRIWTRLYALFTSRRLVRVGAGSKSTKSWSMAWANSMAWIIWPRRRPLTARP